MGDVVVAASRIHGRGVFAARPFEAGEVVLRIDDSRVVDADHPLDPARGELDAHCDYLADGRVVLMPLPERQINSSCDPNTFARTVDGVRLVLARRPIRAGEEITYDYIINCHGGDVWECRCGSDRCRGTIVASFFDLPAPLRAEYGPLLDDWFVREHEARFREPAREDVTGFPMGINAMTPPITIARADLADAASLALIAALNDELRPIYPEPGATHFRLDPHEVGDGRGAFLVVRRGDAPVGCGALRLIDPATAELKRMYVRPEARGAGLGRRLVAALEVEARRLGARRLVLETGIRQAAALALYRRAGFEAIPLYGEYRLSPATSVCLGKDLPAGAD